MAKGKELATLRAEDLAPQQASAPTVAVVQVQPNPEEELYTMPQLIGVRDSTLPGSFDRRIANPADRFCDLKWGEKKLTFNNPYEAYDFAVEADSMLAACLANARESLLQLSSGITPRDGTPLSKQVADWQKAYLDEFMDDENGDGFAGILENVYASIEQSLSFNVCAPPEKWVPFRGIYVPPIWETRPPWMFQFNFVKPCNAQLMQRTYNDFGKPVDPFTIVYHAFQAKKPSRPYGQGLMLDLFPLAHLYNHLLCWAARWSEKYGLPIEKIKYIKSAEAQVKEFLRKQGANRFIAVEIPMPDDVEGGGTMQTPYEVEIEDRQHNQQYVFGDFMKFIQSIYSTRTLGETLTSGTAESGTRALGDVHMEQSNKLMAGRKRHIEKSIMSFFMLIFEANKRWGVIGADVKPAPWKMFADEKLILQQQLDLADKYDLELIRNEVYEKVGFTPPTPEDETVKPKQVSVSGGLPGLASKAAGESVSNRDLAIHRKLFNQNARQAQVALQGRLDRATQTFAEEAGMDSWRKLAKSVAGAIDAPAKTKEKLEALAADALDYEDALYTNMLNRYCLGYLRTSQPYGAAGVTAARATVEPNIDKVLSTAEILAAYREAIPISDERWAQVDEALRDKAKGYADARIKSLKSKIMALADRALTGNWDKARFIAEAQKIIDAQVSDLAFPGVAMGFLWLGRIGQTTGEKDHGAPPGGEGPRAIFGYEWISDLTIPWENHHPGHGEANGYIGSFEAFEANGNPYPGCVPNCLCTWRTISWAEAVEMGWADWQGNILVHEPNGPFPANFEMGLLPV